MDTTLFLARFWGMLLLIVGFLLFMRRRILFDEMFQLLKNRGFTLLSGYIALILGVFSVALYNQWTADWRVIITVFGWLSIIKGIIRVGFPEAVGKVTLFFKKNVALSYALLALSILIGFWLLAMSF